MKLRYLPIAFLAILLVLPEALSAQMTSEANPLQPGTQKTPIYIGPVLGYNRSIHNADLLTFQDDVRCPSFVNGTNNGFFAGISFEYLLGNPVNSTSSIIARVLYNTMPASFTQTGEPYPSIVDPLQPPIISQTEHTYDVTYSMITAEVMYKLNLINTFGITVGPTFDFPIQKSQEQLFKLVEPQNARFKQPDNPQYEYRDNGRTIVVKDGDIADATSFRLGIKAGVQYEILMGRMYIVPGVFYNYGITKLTNEDWFVHAIQAGVDVRFSL